MKLISSSANAKPERNGVLALEENRVEDEVRQTEKSPEKKVGKKRPRKKGSGKKRIILIIVLAALAVAAYFVYSTISGFREMQQSADSLYTYVDAELRDITSTLTGSGTLEPADSYTVTTLVSGEILSAGFEEGDVVSKDVVLYEIDSSDAATSIERAELSLSQSQRSYNSKVSSMADLTISSPISGTITGINARVGDTIGTQSAVATIEDVSSLTLTEYYSDEYEGRIYTGMTATVSVPDQMLNLTGTVKEVSSVRRTSETGVSCFGVTIEVTNVGALTSGTAATCWLHAGNGEEIYPSISDDDGLDAKNRTTVYAGVTGTVADIRVRNNETIGAGQVIMTLSSDTLSDEILNAADSLRDAELSLQSQYDSLDNYKVTAPIQGTIVDKYYKQGETAETGKALCIIYDLSSLSFVMNVDELDINQVSVGQKATITAQAVDGEVYEGVITKVGINGTTTNGVTTYPVTVEITKTDGLLPGMNVDVSIVVESKSSVIAIPSEAVERGDKVLVKTKDGTTGEGAPEGYAYMDIETGISDGDYVEVTSGLKAGDSVAYIQEKATGTDMFAMMGMGGVREVRGGGAQGGGMMP